MKQLKIWRINLFSAKIMLGLVLAGIVIAVLTVYSFKGTNTSSSRAGMADMQVQATPVMKKTFVKLAAAHTDVCQDLGNKPAIDKYMNSLPSGSRMQGSCCSPMDMKTYVSQINGLKKYANIPQIPPDPYDISKASATQMLGYYNDIQLNPAQQAVYDKAQKMTNDNGWCCCQCWAWYTHAGLAKFLISQHNYTAQQVADVTNLEDCCGGAS